MNTWKDVDPKGSAAAKEAMSEWFSRRLEELRIAKLKQILEDIKDGEKLQSDAVSDERIC